MLMRLLMVSRLSIPKVWLLKAGRLMLKRIDTLIEDEKSFSIETTLSTKSYAKLIERAHINGFSIQLLFFWLPSPEIAIKRVERRVLEGGHNIPTDVIVRRYHSGIKNLFNIYMDIVDSWMLVDNYSVPRIIIADGGRYVSTRIRNIDLYLNSAT